MKAFVFPGQGAQYPGMGKEIYEKSAQAKALFETANDVLGFRITDIMFEGSKEDLRQTKVTQPAIFLHSVIRFLEEKNAGKPDMVAGHSLGEFSALVANESIGFEDALKLVFQRASAMQEACDTEKSTMAAVLGLEDEVVEGVCNRIEDIVIPANYNSPGQLVISGSEKGVAEAMSLLKDAGARRVVPLAVGGAFHSPFMDSAKEKLEAAIHATQFRTPVCPVYQNVDALPHTDSEEIKNNLISQLNHPVRWTQSVQKMIEDGAGQFYEFGPGNVLSGLIRKADRKMHVESLA